jgi:uncharacterized protein (UPF0332 family)
MRQTGPGTMDGMDDEISSRVIEQAFSFWIDPEIERRRADGRLADSFTLTAAQVIFDVDADLPDVRLNDEIWASAIPREPRAVAKGKPVTAENVDEIAALELTDHDPNAGHLTIIRRSEGGWFLAFDFRRNAARQETHADAAEEFLDAAAEDLSTERLRVFVDNLLSATELLAKAFLIAFPDERLLKAKRHSLITARFNREASLANVDPAYAKLLNRLWELRHAARYLSGDFVLDETEGRRMLVTGREMLDAVRNRIPNRHTVEV